MAARLTQPEPHRSEPINRIRNVAPNRAGLAFFFSPGRIFFFSFGSVKKKQSSGITFLGSWDGKSGDSCPQVSYSSSTPNYRSLLENLLNRRIDDLIDDVFPRGSIQNQQVAYFSYF